MPNVPVSDEPEINENKNNKKINRNETICIKNYMYYFVLFPYKGGIYTMHSILQYNSSNSFETI